MKQKINFITYGDSKKYLISKKHILDMAKHSNFFEYCTGYGPEDLDKDFVNKYSNILNQKRGGGFYIWKMEIIKKHLEELNDNDILVYCDSGSTLNYLAKQRFFEYIDILNNSKNGNLRFESKKNHIEKVWTTKELFQYFKIDLNSDIANSPQLLGGHLLFQKNEHTRYFIKQFFDVLNDDENLITDYYKNGQIGEFIENRHDQSILSLISKKHGGEILENETFFKKNSIDQKQYPFLSVRHYGHGFRDRILYNLGFYKKTPIYF
ncbi:hypothetical protein N9U49_00790 [Acidimicrobiaceae bacterium]|nr:hypothetical protein [Acidimicrobiaceae bacterium]